MKKRKAYGHGTSKLIVNFPEESSLKPGASIYSCCLPSTMPKDITVMTAKINEER